MGSIFEMFVFEEANKASKSFVDKLIEKAGEPVVRETSFEEIRNLDGFKSLIDFLGLPKHPPRKIDEAYTPPPLRYLITSYEIVALAANKEEKDIEKESISFYFNKLKGTFQYYEIFTSMLFKPETVLAVEDLPTGESKILGYFTLKGIFDFEKAFEEYQKKVDEALEKKE